jgi:ABC-2 type transport system ATP-binding protein
MSQPVPPAIDARGVVRRYGKLTALAGIDLAIARGGITALLGPNGAGKTTFVELALGRGRPDEGEIRTLGSVPGSASARRGTGVMLQSAALTAQLTVREHIELHAGYYACPWPLAEVLGRCSLEDIATRRYSALSGGQQRRVQLALAICGRPQLLVLDEPTVSLDVQSRRRCWSLIQECAQAGAGVLLTTHLIEEAESLADRIVLLRAGQVIADGTARDIRARVAEKTIRCRSTLDTDRLQQLRGIVSVAMEGDRIEMRARDADAAVRALLAADPAAADLEIIRASLEEACDQLINLEGA